LALSLKFINKVAAFLAIGQVLCQHFLLHW